MLLMDSEQKHFHQITKYYVKTYEKYMKYDKYLLLKIEDNGGNGIYLPKCAKIVHFGELEVYRGINVNAEMGSTGSVNREANPADRNNNDENRKQRQEGGDKKSLK